MELTPVKIRGKRKGRNDLDRPAQQLKRVRQDTETRAIILQKARKRKRERKERNRPRRLQNGFAFCKDQSKFLGVELVEKIFLLSENLNFPKASPQLGWLLSSRTILLQIVIQAFGPTWEAFWSAESDEKAASEVSAGDPLFQTSVLKQPWAKFDVLQEAYANWTQRNVSEHRKFFHNLWGKSQPVGEPCAGRDHAGDCFYNDYRKFRYSFRLDRQNSILCVHSDTCIPISLITGPWDTWEKIHRLFWLIRMGARVKMDEMWDSFLEACHRIEKIADPMTQELVIDMLSAFSPTTYKLTGWEQWMTRMPIPAPVLPITILEENGPQDED